MPIDHYAPCPGGTGKKIKFCCPDLVNELEKVQRMLDGEQRAGCLDYIESLQPKYPDRACLLSIKAMLEAQLGRTEAADATISSYISKYPQNPVALAELATLKAHKEGGRAAIEPLQKAVEASEREIASQVYEAIGVVAQALLAQGEVLAARAHFILQLGVQGGDDKLAMSYVVRIDGSAAVPLLLKQDLPLVEAPADALWKGSFAAAMEPALRGAWLTGANRLRELAAKAGDWPPIWRNIATLRAWLADTPATLEALRKFAGQAVPLDDAVEAEALAQLLDPEAEDQIDVLTISYAVHDFDRLHALLSASKQCARIPIDLARLGTENEPPPKGAFWLLDRPVPSTGVGIKKEDIPQVVGQVFLFGRQTDREARAELITYRTEELEKARTAIAAVAGDTLGAPSGEEVTTTVPAIAHVLSWNWRLPDDTPPELRARLLADARREALVEKWPNLQQRIFGGRSARDVSKDDAFRIKLLAAILRLELSTEQTAVEFDYNELRRSLGLPATEPIDPWKVSVAKVPLARLGRLDVMKLSDDDLREAYHRADHYRHTRALKKLAQEVIGRPNISAEDKAAAYGALAEMEQDAKQALAHIDKARSLSREAGKSCGPWDLAELSLRLAHAEVAEADRLLAHIRDSHMREPGIGQALLQLLTEAGIINPDGTSAMPPDAEAAPGLAVPGAGATPEPSKIWTPGSEPAGAGKKSALWTPD